MRVITVIAMAVALTSVLFMRYCQGADMRNFVLPEDDEDSRPHPYYRDYGFIRSRPIREDDAFDDYGHLRFGRSDD
ncbi:hypothetical protein K1T71_002577 [Dendrolimus kikuchii]|uniref:Uncharacterized protein n=1 Tax=Dendrolimus kikuchii TaxID=765133 RepID=A0ACC1DDG6_9NEOP|nr:hypothetical protein K1T71_002577 [Dendrolimus kikuchii]